ncbi:MAG: SAM hydrolase/SAM-dependent halogenase family protein [Thermodesulfobacteriota bacterium]
MDPVFALLTDFGLQDPYVGQMKAVLLSRAGECSILDISHSVRPQDVFQAGFFLASSWPYLPLGSICLAIVDPGVGTERRILILAKQDRVVLAPDNGLLTQVMDLSGENHFFLPSDLPQAEGISPTFHGRDVFAPLAASLALDNSLAAPGEPLPASQVIRLPTAQPTRKGGQITAHVQHVDRFGNCILTLNLANWSTRLLDLQGLYLLEPAQIQVLPVQNYSTLPRGRVGLLPGSQGFLELAVNQDSCARALGLSPGSEVVFQLPE